MNMLYTLIVDHEDTISNVAFLSMGLSLVYYFITTVLFEITALTQSFNERQRRSALGKAAPSDLDAMIARRGAALSAVLVYFTL
jgi:hypothetical protein